MLDQPLGQLLQTMAADTNQQRGEFVVMVAACENPAMEKGAVERVLQALAGEMPPNQAAKIAARISGRPKRELYQLLLKLK